MLPIFFLFYFFVGQTYKLEGCASETAWEHKKKVNDKEVPELDYYSTIVQASRSFLKINKKCHWQPVWISAPG